MDARFGPWTLTSEEQTRLEAYDLARDLVTKRAANRDKLYQRDRQEAGVEYLPQLYVNVPGRVCRAAADLVLPHPPTVRAADEARQERVDALLKRSKLHTLAWKTVYWTAALGDSYLYIADRKERAQEKSLPVVCLRKAALALGRNIRSEDPPFRREFLFKSVLDDGAELYTYYAKQVIRWFSYKNGREVPLPKQYAALNPLQTKEEVPLVVHLAAPRGGNDDVFGESDFDGTEDLVFEIANRLRQVARILDRHADPAMNVPDGMVDEEGKMNLRRKKVFERGVDGRGLEYAVWNSQLEAAYAEIDKLTDLIGWMTETPPALWGRDTGGAAESGRALKFKLLSGLGKARRAGGMLREGLREAVALALRREDIIEGRSAGEYEIEVELPDTFIADEMETSEWVERLRRAGALSMEKAVAAGQGLTGDDLAAEVERLNAEAEPEPGTGLEAGRFVG